jgi:tRNA 2-thiocytidine biosynthesis protein TtcA
MNAELDRLRKRINVRFGRACRDFHLVDEGDRILVCLSGGKDSYTLLTLLEEMQAKVPFEFELVAFHLDQKQPGYPEGLMQEYLAARDTPHVVIEEDTYSVVKEKLAPDATPCSLCSRLRRGIIYGVAEEYRCNKIALGHHRDDSVETLLLNMFHSGQMQAMPAIYTTDDGRFDVIRPMIYLAEAEIARFAELMDYPIIPCNLCGSIEGRRKMMKTLLDELEDSIPHVRNSLLASLQNVRTTHLLDKSINPRFDDEDETESATGLVACGATSHDSLF